MNYIDKDIYLWKNLPNVFTIKQAINIMHGKLLPSTTMRLIRKNKNLYKKLNRGLYKKKDVDFFKALSNIYEG